MEASTDIVSIMCRRLEYSYITDNNVSVLASIVLTVCDSTCSQQIRLLPKEDSGTSTPDLS